MKPLKVVSIFCITVIIIYILTCLFTIIDNYQWERIVKSDQVNRLNGVIIQQSKDIKELRHLHVCNDNEINILYNNLDDTNKLLNEVIVRVKRLEDMHKVCCPKCHKEVK